MAGPFGKEELNAVLGVDKLLDKRDLVTTVRLGRSVEGDVVLVRIGTSCRGRSARRRLWTWSKMVIRSY